MGFRVIVTAEWDDEAKVWVASSDDIPGLATEAATVEELIEKVTVIIPELIEENGLGGLSSGDSFPLEVITRQHRTIALSA